MNRHFQTSYHELARLNQLASGHRAKLVKIEGGRRLARRLLSLGLRVGAELQILQKRGRSVVVASAGTRVAIGSSIAEKMLMNRMP